jgi:hypothetical protein
MLPYPLMRQRTDILKIRIERRKEYIPEGEEMYSREEKPDYEIYRERVEEYQAPHDRYVRSRHERYADPVYANVDIERRRGGEREV